MIFSRNINYLLQNLYELNEFYDSYIKNLFLRFDIITAQSFLFFKIILMKILIIFIKKNISRKL